MPARSSVGPEWSGGGFETRFLLVGSRVTSFGFSEGYAIRLAPDALLADRFSAKRWAFKDLSVNRTEGEICNSSRVFASSAKSSLTLR
jgi:hypothetical protein